jgi:PilX N-terminal
MYITKPDNAIHKQTPCRLDHVFRDEKGSALIIALVLLVVLTLAGVISTQTSTVEIKIAGNDKQYKATFYEADGATELATELIEQNIEESGFDESTMGTDNLVSVITPDFALNEIDEATTPSDTNRDFFIPSGYVDPEPHTNFKVGGEPIFGVGSGLEMAAAYEGRGKSSAQSGVKIIYDVVTQRVGTQNSGAIVRIQYRYVVN